MYRTLKTAMVIPAYNEALLIEKTIVTAPEFIDYLIVVNDGSTDETLSIVKALAKKDSRVIALDNGVNQGLGTTLINGFTRALKTDADLIGVMAGDAQCDPTYIAPMIDELIDHEIDYVKANRFFHREALSKMPRFRRVGNIIITILGKFSTGYYSIFDSQNGYGIFKRQTLEKLPFDMIGKRYDYENTLLIALSIMNARIKDHAVPAIYGEETSTIKFWPTATRALRVLFFGFWRRIYYKYIVYNFHPIALFFLAGIGLGSIGFAFGLYIAAERIFRGLSPSSGTVMLVVLPIIVGLQLVLTAITMDMNNEART